MEELPPYIDMTTSERVYTVRKKNEIIEKRREPLPVGHIESYYNADSGEFSRSYWDGYHWRKIN